MASQRNPAAGQTANGASRNIQVARLNFPEDKPDFEIMQMAPTRVSGEGDDINGELNRLPIIAAKINKAHADAWRSFRAGLTQAIEAGTLLIEAKEKNGHGGWLLWLKDNVDFSDRMARNYMRLAKHQDKFGANSATVADLAVREAIASISNEQQRLARLPAPVVSEVLAKTTDDDQLKGALRYAENRHRFLEAQRRELELVTATKGTQHHNAEQPDPVPFWETLSSAEQTFVNVITWRIDALVGERPGISSSRIVDLLNEAGCTSLGDRWNP